MYIYVRQEETSTEVDLLKGKKKKKKAGKKRKQRGMKPDPGGPDGEDEDSYGEEDSESEENNDEVESDSELDLEAPLRRKAAKEPGSVMKLLVKHAQEQMDRGSLMDHEGDAASVTSGIKIATYFALLIRPYYNNASPMLRELYSLAQTIDLLRGGRLAETADALASRFISVHTALAEGNWQVASTLELFPLEPVQSAGTSTMLAAQKHRRLIWKSQGYPSGGGGNWWSQNNKGKGKQGAEKGKKGTASRKAREKAADKGKTTAGELARERISGRTTRTTWPKRLLGGGVTRGEEKEGAGSNRAPHKGCEKGTEDFWTNLRPCGWFVVEWIGHGLGDF